MVTGREDPASADSSTSEADERDPTAGTPHGPAPKPRDATRDGDSTGPPPDGETPTQPDPTSHVFSFACYPAERVVILVALLVAPAAATLFFLDFKTSAEVAGQSFQEAFGDAPEVRRLAALMGLAAVVLVVFAVVYLQYRAATRVIVGPNNLRFERRAFLPLGWLSREIEVPFADILLSQYRLRRLPFARPELILTFPSQTGVGRERLVLPLAQAWEETEGASRPWLGRPPPSGRWADHRLAALVERRIRRSRSAPHGRGHGIRATDPGPRPGEGDS